MSDARLEDLFVSHTGHISDKWEHYLGIYESELTPIIKRGAPISLLEIGVQNGGSLEIWEKYLPSGSELFGIDIDPKCARLDLGPSITVAIADATRDEQLRAALGHRTFDAIIDDGSHLCYDVIQTFQLLFERLRPGGKYLIEDLHCSYWRSHGGGLRDPGASIEWIKGLVDSLNADHFVVEGSGAVPAWTRTVNRHVARITFYDSVAVVEKLRIPKHAPYRRLLSGETTVVEDPARWFATWPTAEVATILTSPTTARHIERRILDEIALLRDERENDRAELASRDEQIATLNKAVAERDGQIASLNEAVAERDRQIDRRNQAVTERDREIDRRNQRIANLNEAVAERDRQIDRLNQAVAKRDGQIGALRRHAAQRKTEAAAIARQLALVYTSSSWRLTLPLRASRRLLSRLFARNRRTARSPTIGIPAVVGPLAGSVSDEVSTATPRVADRQRAVDDFDRNFYLQAYPDIAASGVDPHQHYLNHGRKEGRLGRAPQLIANAGPQVLSRNRPTILVVSHEASRTGAPILAWNICRELRKRCNVIVMLLGGGGIASYFAEDSDVVIGPYRPQERTAAVVRHIVNELCDRYDIDVALVNSIESRAVIPPLSERFVPSVLLVHEFFAYTRPREDFVAAMRLAADVVFSARIVQRNALTPRTRQAVETSHVLPQGKCEIPTRASTGAVAIAELAKIEAFAQRGGRRCFFVLGAGTVQYRKGVDLFVATAAEVRRLAPEAAVVMLWIGHGFDPEKDLSYSAYVQEQIVSAGIDNIAIVDEIANIEPVYARADALFLSSRLDPMPNVAIDAMSIGKPVICFDNATGVAEVLADHPSTAECILPSANIADAARLILRLQSSPAFADAVSAGVRELAARFHMPTYVARLFDIAWEARTRSLQERSDAATLQDTADFDVGFASTPVSYPRTREQAIVSFLRSSESGIDARRPAPGFDAATYARQHELGRDAANPFAHWLRAGRPDGPWRVEVIDPSIHTEALVAIRLRHALHVHAFYIDLLDDIVARLGSEGPPCDLFVSVASDTDAAQARTLFETYRRGACDVRVVPNCGRDIGPFLTTFCARLRAYDVIGHVHTKHSHMLGDREFVRRWREYLLENLLGGERPSADAILGRFAEDPQLGIVYPDDPHLLDWGRNRDFADALARRMGIPSLPDPPPSFPVGTMFWARPAALAPLLDLALDWSDYPADPLPYDGSMLHAIERLLPIVVAHTGYRRAAVHVPGSTR